MISTGTAGVIDQPPARTGQHSKLGRLTFAVCLLIALTIKLAVVAIPALKREIPIEPDDGYSYIVKAAQLWTCPLQDCPALEDLRRQLRDPVFDQKKDYERWDVYTRAFMVFHPLHSLLISLPRLAGLSWEKAHMGVSVVGAAATIGAIGYFLYVLWGPFAAGIGLVLVAFTPFRGHGLDYVVPATMTLGLAAFAWGEIIRRRGESATALIVAIIAMLTMHHLGKIYALASILILLLLADRPYSSRTRIIVIIGTGLVGAAFLLPLMVTRPDLSLGGVPEWLRVGVAETLHWNFPVAATILKSWADRLGGIPAVAVLVAIALVALDERARRDTFLVLLVLVAILTASVLHFHPGHPATLFERTSVPVAIVLSGAIAYALCLWSAWVFSVFAHASESRADMVRSQTTMFTLGGWVRIGLLSAAALYAPVLVYHIGTGLLNTAGTVESRLRVDSRLYSPAQVRALVNADRGCGRVVYDSLKVMQFYLSYGALECGAVFRRGVEGTNLEEKWLGANAGLTHLAANGPITHDLGRLPLGIAHGPTLTFASPGGDALAVRFDNEGGPTRVTLMSKDGIVAETLDVPANSSQWWILEGAIVQAAREGLDIATVTPSRHIYLAGIRRDANRLLRWPWDQGVSVTFGGKDGSGRRTEDFSSEDFIALAGYRGQVIDDAGSSFLIELSRR